MVTMQLLKNDKKNNTAYYHCLAEGHEDDCFDLGIDYVNKEIVYNPTGRRDGYSTHAAHRIYDVYEEKKEIPEKEMSMWY